MSVALAMLGAMASVAHHSHAHVRCAIVAVRGVRELRGEVRAALAMFA